MADVERSLISKVIETGELSDVIAQNIEPDHFADEQCAEIYEWMLDFQRRYRAAPSARAVKQEFPHFARRVASEPLGYHIDRFVLKAKERAAIELVRNYHDAIEDPELLPDIELHALEMARGLTEIIPSPSIQRFSAMPSRTKEYERRQKKGIRHGTDMGIPTFDKVTEGY